MSFFGYFTVLLLIQKRQPLWSLAELIFPLFFAFSVLLIDFQVKKIDITDKNYSEFPVFGNALDLLTPVDDVPLLANLFQTDMVYFAPKTEKTTKIMADFQRRYYWTNVPLYELLSELNIDTKKFPWSYVKKKKISVKEYCKRYRKIASTDFLKAMCKEIKTYQLKVKGFESENDLISKIIEREVSQKFIGVVIFSSQDSRNKIGYKLRFRYYHKHLLPEYFSNKLAYQWLTKFSLPSSLEISDLKFENLTDGGLPAYWREMFLSLQKGINTVLMEDVSPPENREMMSLFLQRFPYPAHQKNSFYNVAQVLILLTLLFSFMLPVLYVTKSIAAVQEGRIKEYLFISGLHPMSFWSSYFVISSLKLTVPVLVLAGVFQKIFPKSNFLLILVFVLLYSMNALFFAFAVSSVVRKATVATVASAVLWFAMYLPTLYLQKLDSTFGQNSRILFCLLLNTATSYGVQIFSAAEAQGEGITIKNAWVTFDGISLGMCCCFMAIDCIIWLMICAISQIPLEFLSQLCGQKVEQYQSKLAPSVSAKEMTKNNEKVCKIEVRNLSVVLSPGSSVTVAVKGVCFDAHDKKSTVLLGRNGSGKTTVMSVLAGLLKSAEGTAHIGHLDVGNDRKALRKIVGYCPQYNPLFDQLTVKEHLQFFTNLRKSDGFSTKHMGKTLNRLNLWEKRYTQAQNLSGGMRRKLSLAIALCGQPKVVLLDEPTSGLDPGVRKQVQQMLLEEKRHRLVLLTTHYLEEADTLGDQVIIMNKGKVLDKGSSRTLKKKYGEFLTLSVSFEDGDIRLCAEEVYSVVKSYSRNSFNVELDGRYMNIRLRTHQWTWEKLGKVMEELNHSRALLKISRMKVAITSLEDVFQLNIDNARKDHLEDNIHLNSNEALVFKSDKKMSGLPLFFAQMLALLLKKLLVTSRQPWFLLVQLLIPLVSTSLGVFVNQINRRYAPESPSLNLADLAAYSGSKAYIQLPPNAREFQQNIAEKFQNILSPNIQPKVLENSTISMNDVMLDDARTQGENKFMNYSHYFAASISNKNKLTMFFNNIAPHSIATATNLASNAILKATMGETYEIRTENHPLPPEVLIFFQFGEEFVLALCISIGILIFLSIFTVYPTTDRTSGTKHLQKLVGVTVLPYWVPVFMVDLLICMVISMLLVLVLWIGGVRFLADKDSWYHILLLLIAHSWAVLPLSYLGSMLFRIAAEGMAKMVVVNFVLSVVPACISATLVATSFDKDQAHLKNMERSFSGNVSAIIPQFAFSKALMTYYSNRLMIDQCERMNKNCTSLGTFSISYEYLEWDHPGIGRQLLFLLVQGCILVLLLLTIEHGFIQRLIHRLRKSNGSQSLFQKTYTDIGAPVLELLDFCVKYGKEKSYAVKNLGFVLRKKDCVCLVGKNGAGKTSLLSALTGQMTIKRGSAYVCGFNLEKRFHKASRCIGFCPQFDALRQDLTVLENLNLFAKLRGIHGNSKVVIIDSIIRSLAIEDQAGKLVKNLSGGNKRKASLGVSILDAPPVLLLDEPTSGIDPTGRKLISQLLAKLRHQHETSILLASHSLDVIESLCTEVAVLEYGSLKFRGSMAEFAKTNSNYTLRITASNEQGANTVTTMVTAAFPESKLQISSSLNERCFTIGSQGTTHVNWVTILNAMDKIQSQEKLHDFEASEAFLSDYVMRM